MAVKRMQRPVRRRKKETPDEAPDAKRPIGTLAVGLGVTLAATLLFGGVAVGARAGYEAAVVSEYLIVAEVKISGNGKVARPDIEAMMSRTLGENILALDLAAVGDRLAAHPWIATASVRRDLPSRLTVEIVERRPAALLADGAKRWLVDADGVLLATVAGEDDYGLVTVVGAAPPAEAAPGDRIDARRLAPALAAAERLAGYRLMGQGGVSRVDATRPDRLILSFAGSATTVIVPRGEWSDEAARLATVDYLLRSKKTARVAAINLLFDGKVVVTFTGDAKGA
jgi:cell division protein FtsQ